MSYFSGDTIRRRFVVAVLALLPAAAIAAPVAARRRQEPMHQLLVVKSADGKVIANGEEICTADGNRIRSDLVFRFLDGSLDEQITIFTQDQVFRLINDRHVQKGPSFPTSLDFTVDVPSSTVTWHQQKSGRDKVYSEHVALPDDVANGLIPLLAENVAPGSAGLQVSWIAVALRPILVTITVQPDPSPAPASAPSHAQRLLLHPELHGLAWLVAPLLDKQPADLHFSVSDDPQPSFLRVVGPFYQGGPVWTVENVGPEIPTTP
jgi:hypothetical protein